MIKKAAALLVIGGLALMGGAAAADTSPQFGQGPGISALGACAADTHRMDVAVMMDESGSLAFVSDGNAPTDPHAERVGALRELLGGLASLASGPSQIRIFVGLSGFSTDSNTVQPFTALNPQSLPAMQRAASSFATKDTGPDTDFYSALASVRDQLAAQAASAGGRTCQVFVLFTDGFYSFSVRPGLTRPYSPGGSADTPVAAQALAAAGQAAICRAGGLIDQLRNDGIFAITVGLGPGAGQGAALLSGLAGAGGCGAVTPPGGLFLPASDVGVLSEAFDVAGAELAGGTDVGSATANPRHFYLGADLRQLDILVRTSPQADIASAIVTAPDGTSAPISRPAATLDGISFAVAHSTDGYIELQGVPADTDGRWAGLWTLSFGSLPGAQTSSEVIEFPDLVPSIASGTTLERGTTTHLTVRLRRLDRGVPRPAETAAPHLLKVGVVDPTRPGAATPVFSAMDGSGTYTASVPVAVGDAATSLVLALDLKTTAPDGSALTDIQRSVTLPVELPPSFPKVSPLRIDFGAVTGTRDVSANVEATGGSQAGCLRIGSLATASAPSGVQSPNVAAPRGCLPIAAGQSRRIVLVLHHRGSGSGTLRGSVSAAVVDSSGRSLSLRLPVQAEFVLPVHPAVRDLLLALLVLGGALLPLACMYGIALAGARFRPLAGLRYVDFPVSVTAQRVESAEEPLDQVGRWMRRARPLPPGAGAPRRLAIPDGPVVRSRVSFNPFAAPRAWAEHPSADVVGHLGCRHGSGRWVGEMAPKVGAAWTFEVKGHTRTAANEPQLDGTLILLCAETEANPNPWPEAAAHAATRLPSLSAPNLEEAAGAGGEIRPDDDVRGPTTDGGAAESDPRLSLDIFESDSTGDN